MVVLGSETDFKRTTLEGRGFLPLFWKESHVIGVRLFLDYKAGDVPFYHLPELSSQSSAFADQASRDRTT